MKTRKNNHHRPFMGNGQAGRTHSFQSKREPVEMKEFSGFIRTDLGSFLSALTGPAAESKPGAPCPIHFGGNSVNMGPIVCCRCGETDPVSAAHNAQLIAGYEKLLVNRDEEIKQLKQRIQKLEKKIALEESGIIF